MDTGSQRIFESWTRIEDSTVRGRHVFTIDDFINKASRLEHGDVILSDLFSVPVTATDGKSQEVKLQMEVYPNGNKAEHAIPENISVCLTSHHKEVLLIKYNFSVLKTDGDYVLLLKQTFSKFSPDEPSWGCPDVISKAELIRKELLPDNKLTIICNFEISGSERRYGGPIDFGQEETPSLANRLSTAFTLDQVSPFSDFIIKCEGKTFHCHKFMLVSSSEVFAAMFSHPETLEAKTGVLQIEDSDPEDIEHLLRFIYTDVAEVDGDQAAKLLPLADKYMLPRLKSICEKAIWAEIDASNAIQSLILGHLHNAKNLKSAALNFVSTNRDKITKEDWEILEKCDPSLPVEILKNLIK